MSDCDDPGVRVVLVAGVARDGTIGHDGGIPWHYTEDLRTFKRSTLGTALVMGRKTLESIGRLLPGRPSIVLSRSPERVRERYPGAHVVRSLDDAWRVVRDLGHHVASVIGGGEVYRLALPCAHELLLTEVPEDGGGDVTFPAFDRDGTWREVSRERIDRVELVRYVRASSAVQAARSSAADSTVASGRSATSASSPP